MARLGDVYAALPSLTGKVELEYEGELVGVERMALELVRGSVADVFSVYMGSADLSAIIEHFEQGGSLKLPEEGPSKTVLQALAEVPGLLDAIGPLGDGVDAPPGVRAAAAEFVLEGLYAQKEDRTQPGPRLHEPGAPAGAGPRLAATREPSPHEEEASQLTTAERRTPQRHTDTENRQAPIGGHPLLRPRAGWGRGRMVAEGWPLQPPWLRVSVAHRMGLRQNQR